jgi:hypothetical protein
MTTLLVGIGGTVGVGGAAAATAGYALGRKLAWRPV